MKKKQVIGIIVAVLVVAVIGFGGVLTAAAANRLNSGAASTLYDAYAGQLNKPSAEPVADSIAMVYIVGTIGPQTYNAFGIPTGSYDQTRVLELIKAMTESDTNKGLFLYVDSPGGGVFESDEVYLALMKYKEETGRPIYAYAHSLMASGAYYISCAADTIVANRNAQVGSIGVYIQTVNYAGLYEKLGINGEYIRSGPNKAMGNQYDVLTDEQRAIYQSIVDECYDEFLRLVCDARGFTREQALPICDGRIYTAKQALAVDLIDALNDYETSLEEFKAQCGVTVVYAPSYSSDGILNWFSALIDAAPKNEYDSALELIEQFESGVPMYHA